MSLGAPTGARRCARWWLLPALAVTGLGMLAAGLLIGHGLDRTPIPGLPDAGPLVAWALPATRLAVDASATLTVGLCLAAAFLLPGHGRTISAQGYRLRRLATGTALGWATATSVLLVLTTADLLGQSLTSLRPAAVLSVATSISQGQALTVQAGLALAVAVLTRVGQSRTTAATTVLVAAIGVVPPALTGHSASAGDHQLAVSSLALHVLAAALWAGGLAALVLLRGSRLLPDAAHRYSRLALACYLTIAVSGLANAAVRLDGWSHLADSRYGLLLTGKIVALLVLGGLGVAHRTRTLPALRRGARRAFLRLAAGELVVFAAAFGLAVAVSRSPTPAAGRPGSSDALVEVLGFPMPAPPSPATLLGQPLPDLAMLAITVAGIVAYLGGAWRLHRRGHRWPHVRTASWVAGLLLLGAVTNLGVARYAYLLFSIHMAQHMVLSMAVPLLLVGGAPLTLALRALRRPSDPQMFGAREWLLIILHSRAMRLLTHPLVALGIYTTSLYGLYLSNALAYLMRYHLGHLLMLTHFVVSGYLLFWTLIGIDPGRRRVPPPLLILVHFAAMALHAFFGVILMQSTTLIAADWYQPLHPPWAASLLTDQHLAAGIAWGFGEIPGALVMVILVRRWMQADHREQARLDRAADRAQATGQHDELARYNAFLARAAQATNRR